MIMLYQSLIPLSLILAVFHALPADALKFPFHVKNRSNNLHRRASITGQSTGNGSVPIANTHNAEYISNITIGGQTVPVMLDTGRYDIPHIYRCLPIHPISAQIFG